MKSRESPIKHGPDVLKKKRRATPAGYFGNYTHSPVSFVFSHLEVPSIAEVEWLEKLICFGDEYNLLEFFLPPPETHMK